MPALVCLVIHTSRVLATALGTVLSNLRHAANLTGFLLPSESSGKSSSRIPDSQAPVHTSAAHSLARIFSVQFRSTPPYAAIPLPGYCRGRVGQNHDAK